MHERFTNELKALSEHASVRTNQVNASNAAIKNLNERLQKEILEKEQAILDTKNENVFLAQEVQDLSEKNKVLTSGLEELTKFTEDL